MGIYGSGGLGREVFELAQDIEATGRVSWRSIVFIDDTKPEGLFRQSPVSPFESFIHTWEADKIEIAIAVGEPSVRRKLAEKVGAAGFRLCTLVHPNAKISPSAMLEEGVVVKSGAIVSCDARIRRNSFLQDCCLVGHDVHIGENTVVSSFVTCAGHVFVGSDCYLGVNACIKESTTIGSETIIGMGSVVLKNIPNEMIAMGNPARPMRVNTDKRVF